MSEPVNAAPDADDLAPLVFPTRVIHGEDEPVRTVGIWRMVRQIHGGKWCDLFLAQPADSVGNPRCDYVVKILRGSWQEDPEGARQVRAEAMSASAARHPHLEAVLDANLEVARPYLVFPRMKATTLGEASLGKEIPVPVALWWVRQCAQALHALHQAGWIHGDVKPENILVDDRGHATLIDLGMAAVVGSGVRGAFRGTVRYAAPERLEGREWKAQPSADIYSIGVVLEELIRGGGVGIDAVHRVIAQAKATNPRNRPSADALVAMLLRLEIDTLHLHIRPNGRGLSRAA